MRALDELNEPLVDLQGFFLGDHESTSLQAARAVGEACSLHGFFQAVNHGIDLGLIQAAHDWTDLFFGSPMETKPRARKQAGVRVLTARDSPQSCLGRRLSPLVSLKVPRSRRSSSLCRQGKFSYSRDTVPSHVNRRCQR